MNKRLAILSAGVLALAACSNASGIQTGGGYTIAVSDPSDASMTALLSGEIITDEDGCLRLGDGSTNPLIVWVSGTTIDDNGVVTSNGHEYRVGETITGGGGRISLQEPYAECKGVEAALLDPEQ